MCVQCMKQFGEIIAFYPNVLYWLVAVLYSAISYFDVYLLAFWTKKAIQQKLATYGFSKKKKNQLWCSHYGFIRSWGAQKQSTFWEDLREKSMIIEANRDLRGGQMAITFDLSEIIRGFQYVYTKVTKILFSIRSF